MRELATDTGFHVAHAYEHCQHEFEVAKDHVRYGEGEKLRQRSVEVYKDIRNSIRRRI